MDAGEGSDAERDVALRDVNKPFIYIFCEDAYGKLFFKWLVDKINVESSRIRVGSFKGPFDSKAEIAVKAASYSAGKIIVVLDRHGKQSMEKEINDKLKNVVAQRCKFTVVVCENSIEDWLVANDCIEVKENTALDYLKRIRKYEKRHLPGYAARLKLDKLLIKSPSFKKFYENLLDP